LRRELEGKALVSKYNQWLADDPITIQYGCWLSPLAGFSKFIARRQPATDLGYSGVTRNL